MKPTPEGWPRLSVSMFYDDPRAAIDFLCAAFGFEVRLLVEGEGGTVEHSEITFGEALVMVGQADSGRPGREWARSPRTLGAATGAPCLFVDDVDAHCERARKAGARIATEPKTSDYGDDYWSDRSYGCFDPEGHHWWFMQRLKTGGKTA
ncbi:MAG: VOC family protein [Myxococcota bacterium]